MFLIASEFRKQRQLLYYRCAEIEQCCQPILKLMLKKN